jgi:hypothetical protein
MLFVEVPMKRWTQGLYIILGTTAATTIVLAAALAWGPHHCKLAFPMVIGCAMGSYESLAGGLFAANAALFAGWLAWSAVQVQISAEARRAAADRVEIESVIQGDLDNMAEGLSSIWKVLANVDRSDDDLPAETLANRLEGVIYGIEQLTKDIPTYRTMVAALGWQRRRDYEWWLDGLERLGQFRDVKNFDVHWALSTAMEVSDYFRILRPETGEYFKGLWQRSPKAWTLGYTIAVYAGVGDTYYDQPGKTD